MNTAYTLLIKDVAKAGVYMYVVDSHKELTAFLADSELPSVTDDSKALYEFKEGTRLLDEYGKEYEVVSTTVSIMNHGTQTLNMKAASYLSVFRRTGQRCLGRFFG